MRKPALVLAFAIARPPPWRRRAIRARRRRTLHKPGLLLLSAADRIVSELIHDPSLVVLSLPVDYWDYIGWKDTFASPPAQRQKGYAAARGGDGQVYTPQAG